MARQKTDTYCCGKANRGLAADPGNGCRSRLSQMFLSFVYDSKLSLTATTCPLWHEDLVDDVNDAVGRVNVGFYQIHLIDFRPTT